MMNFQKVIKYLAIAFACFLVVSIIGSVFSLFVYFVSMFDNQDDSPMKKYEINEVINDIEIDVSSTNLVIQRGLLFSIETNNKYIKYEIDDRELSIEEKNHFINNTSSKLIVTIPYHLGGLSVDAGAGKVEIDKLEVNNLELDLGAGKTDISNVLVLNNCDIDGGAGEIIINESDITNMDLDMGVGKVELNSKLNGNSEINAGVGEVNLELVGGLDDYRFDVSKGIGSIVIDNHEISNDTVYGNGQNKVRISGGVGEIEVKFRKIVEEF